MAYHNSEDGSALSHDSALVLVMVETGYGQEKAISLTFANHFVRVTMHPEVDVIARRLSRSPALASWGFEWLVLPIAGGSRRTRKLTHF